MISYKIISTATYAGISVDLAALPSTSRRRVSSTWISTQIETAYAALAFHTLRSRGACAVEVQPAIVRGAVRLTDVKEHSGGTRLKVIIGSRNLAEFRFVEIGDERYSIEEHKRSKGKD
jgi:hypothetical protein